MEKEFTAKRNVFRFFDVGGQRSERKHWIHCFEHVSAVVFVASIGAYDQKLMEDGEINRLHEALALFEVRYGMVWYGMV